MKEERKRKPPNRIDDSTDLGSALRPKLEERPPTILRQSPVESL